MYIPEASIRKLPKIRYRQSENEFYQTCKSEINQYFKQQDVSPYGGARMIRKTIILLCLFLISYTSMFVMQPKGVVLIFIQCCFHFTMFLMAVGIVHDATHGAYSSKAWVNNTMCKLFDLIGINSYLWDFNHVRSHHNAPNIPIFDAAIFSVSLFRLHPRARYCWYHRYQHYYIFVIYSLSTLFKVLIFDFFSFAMKRIGYVNTGKHSTPRLLYLIGTKILVITYTLALPLIFLEAPGWQILTGFVLGHLISGLALGVIFMVTHLHQHTRWPEPNASGLINNSFPRHIFETTSDFAVKNRLVTWISGGLNIHVVHHLFPRISQVHLPALVGIVQQVAARFGMRYYIYPSSWAAIKSHLYIIRKLGQPHTLNPLEKPPWIAE